MPLDGVLFIPYRETLKLLSVEEAMQVCEDVYHMHAKGSVQWSAPPSWKLDVDAPWHNHWQQGQCSWSMSNTREQETDPHSP